MKFMDYSGEAAELVLFSFVKIDLTDQFPCVQSSFEIIVWV